MVADVINPVDTQHGIGILSLFTQLGLTKSNSQALALLKQGGLYLDNKRITDQKLVVPEHLLQTGTLLVLRVGKRNRQMFEIVEVVEDIDAMT